MADVDLQQIAEMISKLQAYQGPQGYQGTQGPQGSPSTVQGPQGYQGSSAGAPPIGTILPWVGGYFTNGSNAGYTRTQGGANTVAGVNALLNGDGWYVCDGAALNDAASPIFNGAGRYLPNLTDDRFLNGSTACGTAGGSNVLTDHTHSSSLTAAGQTLSANSSSVTISISDPGHGHSASSANDGNHYHQFGCTTTCYPYSVAYEPAGQSGPYKLNTDYAGTHSHTITVGGNYTGITASGTVSISHTHAASAVSGTIGSGSAPGSTENRPKYLTVFFIMRVK